MEGKVLLQDLAQTLAAKRNMQRKDAEAFMKAFFETISDGILQDKIVKVKGLGTFKMIEVQNRESVNVNTGERIVIPGHSKISFTPDTELKDEVNKPFALFQTVIINEGTSIEDMEKVEPVVDSIQATNDSFEESQVDSSDNKHEESIVAPLAIEPEVLEITKEPKEEQPSPINYQPLTTNKPSWWYISPAMTALLFAFFWIVLLIGYFVGNKNWIYLENIFNRSTPEPIIQVDTVFVVKFTEPDSVYMQGLEDSLRNVIKQESKAIKEQPKVSVASQPDKAKSQSISATKKTPTVFEIVGYKGVRTIQWGDYLLKIVRQEYGTDDALKYVISYNNFTNPNNLPVGTEVKLPKLKEK